MNFKHVLTVIIFVSVFSGCISQPVPSETSVPTVIPTVIPPVTPTVIPTHAGMVQASISLESSAENITIYVPVLLDENKTVLKMYDAPEIIGNVTTAIIDTEHGKALKISKSGQLKIFKEIIFQDQHVKLNIDGQTPEQTYDEFFSQFTISMSNYKAPEHFNSMPSDPNINTWVYSDSEVEKVRFSFFLDPRTAQYESEFSNSGTALDINTQDWWVHLRKGWQVVKLSRGQIAWDSVPTATATP
ncbi:MAG: hypothetical protein O8C64_12870 [Candidatus Methanoperedens sp.]|nr:hypothetical protein [Candidatus Methanoperedens sp.]MCZ7383353.1 hypothetical protein [Candidatus Methanoperedens sp.]MCZ7403981.1 hypothetical protein [Candidatus Methanoperedens sp.]